MDNESTFSDGNWSNQLGNMWVLCKNGDLFDCRMSGTHKYESWICH